MKVALYVEGIGSARVQKSSNQFNTNCHRKVIPLVMVLLAFSLPHELIVNAVAVSSHACIAQSSVTV